MSDKALSMSLDDYIKTQKKGNAKQQQPGNRARGKGSGPQVNVGRNLSNKHKTRYFQSGGGGGAGRIRGGNPKSTSRTAVNGRKNGGRLSRPTLGGIGGNRNGKINPNAGKRATGLQFKRINNRLNVGGRIRPRISQRTNRLETGLSNPRLNQRAQRFGTNGNRNQNQNQVQALVSIRNSNQGSAGNRNRSQQNRKNWTRGLNRNSRVLPGGGTARSRNSNSNSLGTIKPKPNIRVRNKRVQQLIQKRIQRARVTLARKTVNRNNLRIAPALLTSRRSGGPRSASLITANPRVRISKAQRALAQQKLNRARQARARNGKIQRQGDGPSRRQRQNNRGLILDRNNLVKVRVANDFRSRSMQPNFHPSMYQHQHQQSASSSSYAAGPYPLMSVSHGYPEHDHGTDMAMGYPDDFPPFVLSNNLSRDREQHAMAMESSRQSLNPDIQRKISIIQNRAKHSRNQLEILPDFKGPVSTCKVNPGDRFRMMMN